jgi:hypothetical protein
LRRLKPKQPQYDFERRRDRLTAWPYAVLKGNHTIGRTKTRRHAALLTWALTVEDIIFDERVMSFVSAVTGMLGMTARKMRNGERSGRSLR